jgi:hypothetical protein
LSHLSRPYLQAQAAITLGIHQNVFFHIIPLLKQNFVEKKNEATVLKTIMFMLSYRMHNFITHAKNQDIIIDLL